MKTLPKGPFLGINNRRPDFALHVKDTGDFVRDAVNVDLDNAGLFRRRKVSALINAQVSPHSLYMVSATSGYVVRSGAIYSIALPSYSETLFKLLSNNDPVHWLEWNGDIYYSNGVDSGRIRGSTWYPIALPTLAEPSVSSQTGGTLEQGWYQIAYSYYNSATGEEGGVSPSCNYQLTSGGTIRVVLPNSTSGATHAIIYCSTLNGSIPLYKASVALGGVGYYDITSPGSGREANQRYEAPLPGGKLFMFNGCLCSYNGKNVYEGVPFRPGYYLPSEGRIPFTADVSNCVPAQNGIYIVADKAYWIPGTRITTAQDVIQDVLPYGAVAHTEFEVPNKTQYGWFSDSGFVIAGTNGEVQAIMSDNIKIDTATLPSSGVSAVIESQEYRRVVACGWCVNLDTKAATRYSDFDFTSISKGYATKSDGIYLLESTGDVSYSIDLGKENFGVDERKRLPAVYFAGTSGQHFNLKVDTSNRSYAYPTRSFSDDLQMQRCDPGKGLSASWYNLSIVGDADFTLASISFAPVASTRRI